MYRNDFLCKFASINLDYHQILTNIFNIYEKNLYFYLCYRIES